MRIFVPSASELLTDCRPHGEGLIAWHLLTGLAARGHELVVCARDAELESDPPFELVLTGRRSRFESIEPLAYMRFVERLCRRLGAFDVAHWLFPVDDVNPLFVPPRGLPLVLGPHWVRWPRPRRRLRAGDVARRALRPAFARARRRTYDSARVLLATTPAAATALDPDRTRLLPPGIRMQRFARAPLPERTRILFVGSLTQKKGIRDLVEAFGLVHERVDDVELVLAGDGPEREWIADRARTLKLNGSLRVLGALPNERVPGLLAESSLLCLPSHGEPFGMAALEAMAAGRAVVGTDAGGLRELVDPVHGGRLVPVGSADELADTLVDLLSAPQLLSELGEFNRGRAEEQYALERVLDRLESVYAEAVS